MKRLFLLIITLLVGYYFWNGQEFSWPTEEKVAQGIEQVQGGLTKVQKTLSDPETKEQINEGLLDLKEVIADLRDHDGAAEKSTQEAFLAVRENPGIFMILFSDDYLNTSGEVVKRNTPLRAETWTFGTPDNLISEFENGFFTGETPLGETLDLMPHDISPLWFRVGMSEKDVIKRFKNPSCETIAKVGTQTFKTLKYAENDVNPYITTLLVDDRLAAVTVGVAFAENNILCP